MRKYSIRIPDIGFWKDLVPCQMGCPIHTDAGRYVQLIAERRYREAYLTARSPNPLASVCGRVCAAPCEDSCRRGAIDAPVTIRALKRFVTEKYGIESTEPDTQRGLFEGEAEPGNKWPWHLPLQVAGRRNARGRVAVIGSGPAGLSCAHDLALMGYEVSVFEATNVAGGMLRHGIPEYRLSRSLIDKEIEAITRLGVAVHYDSPVGPGRGIGELKAEGFRAVVISVGTQKGRDLSIDGSDLDGVVRAIDYLLNVNRGYRVDLGGKVLVIGGGFVAFDAARTALRGASDAPVPGIHDAVDAARSAIRGGASEVHIASLESFSEMPVLRTAQGHEEFEEARREGIVFHPQRGPKRFFGENGKLRGVELIGVKRTYDDSGRFNPVFDPGHSELFDVDSAILAIGQRADLSFIRPEDGVELTPGGLVKADPETLATSAAGVFACGDVAFGPRNIIDAVANGKRAAMSVDGYLRAPAPGTCYSLSIEKIPTRQFTRPVDYEKLERVAPPVIGLDRRTGISEVEMGYDELQAVTQAERCLACHVQTIYDPEKCVLCNRCVDICPEYCLRLVPAAELDLDESTRARLFDHYAIDPVRPASAMLKDDETCIRCGLCALRCPTDAMTMEVFYYEQKEVA